MPGAQCTRGLACEINKAHERSHHRSTGITRHSRTQWFYGLLRALPGDRACLSPSSRGLRFCPCPVGSTKPPRDLTPASRRQNHTTSPSAISISRLPVVNRSRETRPAITSHAQRRRVHRIPFPTSVTIAKRPSVGRDGERYRFDSSQAGIEIFLQTHIDEALVWSRRRQPLILVALHGTARATRGGSRWFSRRAE
jgi:hypothetical protein